MVQRLEVCTDTLDKDVESLETEIQSIMQEIENLKNAINSLGFTWEGNAKVLFTQAVQDDIHLLDEITKAIKVYIENTDNVKLRYDHCERSVGDIISTIRV